MEKTYRVKCLTEGTIYNWTLSQILEEINRDHSEKFTPYDSSDWQEGWNEWVEGYTFTLLDKVAQ